MQLIFSRRPYPHNWTVISIAMATSPLEIIGYYVQGLHMVVMVIPITI